MDEAWVPNKFMATEHAKNSGIFTPHYIVPHPCDISTYQKEYEPLEIPEIQNTFVFYYIGENTRRKNISAILKAFHLEFGKNENVSLLLKSHSPGMSPNQSVQALQALCDGVKKGLKLYRNSSGYKKEAFICDYLSDEQIMRIHQTGDCHVSASFGEAWSIPTFDAMAMGKTPICTDTGGPRDYLGDGGYLVKSEHEPCFGMIDTFENIYTGNENWDIPSINHLRKCMRSAFENKEEREKKAKAGVQRAYDFSYLNIGNIMKSILLDNENPLVVDRRWEWSHSHPNVMGEILQ
jgi:glycosyltransferase involved in cell wall biosynthesis